MDEERVHNSSAVGAHFIIYKLFTVPYRTTVDIAEGCVFTARIRKTSQRHFSTIYVGGLGLRAMVRGWVNVRVGVRVMVGVRVRKVLGSR